MLKRTIKYLAILVGIVTFSFFLTFSIKAIFTVYDKTVENNKKINFLEDTSSFKNTPSICFQSANELAIETKKKLPEIIPMGSIPNSSSLKNRNIINYDKFGFRNQNSVWQTKKHDYLILGDSVVADHNISDDFLFSNNFHLSQSAINLGCGGNGLLTSLYLLEQFLNAGHSVDKVLFFINLDNDFSKDTIREYNTKYFTRPYNDKHNNNLFLNQDKYEKQYLSFIKESFFKSTHNFSIVEEMANQFNKKNFIKDFKDVFKVIKKNNNKKKITLENGRVLSAKVIPKGFYGSSVYNAFLKILERSANLQSKYGISITFLFIPTHHEIDTYNSEVKSATEQYLFLNYRFLKHSLMSTIANYNMNIIDLIYFIEENNYKHFTKGHFSKEAHSSLANYIEYNIENNNAKSMSKHMFYSSFFASNLYNVYQVNFGKKLNSAQIENWIDIINNFLQQNIFDNYLLSPALGYFFLNKDCHSIVRLNKISKSFSSKHSVGDFFYKVCTLKDSENMEASLKEIKNLTNGDVRYYLPSITKEIKNSIKQINENK